MSRKILIICVDGLGPEYIEAASTPNMDRMTKIIGRSVIPSVTNVNNVSIITGSPPSVHGITSNYWLDRDTGEEKLMESAEFLCHPTILQRAKDQGMSTALLTSKKKLLYLLNTGADYSLSAEEPDEEMIKKIGPAVDIYSPDINPWLFRAARFLLKERNPDILYCSTTDGMMHKYAPDEEGSIKHIQELDSVLGEILAENLDREIYLTADHGMSPKTRGIDIEKVLASHNINARAIPIIKDRYVAHHQNLGGASYIYLNKQESFREAMNTLQETSGIEEVHSRAEAAEKFSLMQNRIGDIFALGDRDTVFGQFPETEVPVQVRSHGSRYESTVPILTHGFQPEQIHKRNFDITTNLFEKQ